MENCVTFLSFISKKAMEEESGDHQYAVVMSSSSGYTQSSSPFRTSSLPALVNARSFPSAVLTSQRLWSRMELTYFPSGEIFLSASSALPLTSTRGVCEFKSYHTSAVELSRRRA